ncbi:Sensor histidine kinase YpdA [Pseudidiomarina piscicola]|uniref:Sensor histidine kinase YpdA n=1 Tax=Pseudidiomarina piscicola TaxID=2614830 RepID=A0A6S6WLC5_9GAMM|nr:histidine kinase [Pseudidiomarina piscicola]CAB0150747.1 Sensor histidine kinase YpdA [Pseudidiomarina piscicola]VZT40252.1 Sensor histidine kinase YpdA [Pseudomonas aeruginosa]
MPELTKKELFIALLGLSFISATITFLDWWQRGQAGTSDALLAGVVAIVFLFWVPISSAIFAIKRLGIKNILYELLLWFGCFYIGYRIWGFALAGIYSAVNFGWLDVFFMSIPWAIGTYILYRAYRAYKALQIERLLRQHAELNQLKHALHPHFLFNSLNTLTAFITSNPEKAELLTDDLASVLRHILDTNNVDTISLKHELMILQKWLNIELARLGDDLKIDIDIDEAILDVQIPPFLLQPLLENSIKHATQFPIELTLKYKTHGSALQIIIRDNGPGFPDAMLTSQPDDLKHSGVGLSTTIQRIGLMRHANIQLSNDPESKGAVVTISLESNHG